LSKLYKERRLRFACVHAHWTIKEWSKVIWNKSIFKIGKGIQRILVWRLVYEECAWNCLQPTFKLGKDFTDDLGCIFIGYGKSLLVFISKDWRIATDPIDLVYQEVVSILLP
jgi:hypothetical protein